MRRDVYPPRSAANKRATLSTNKNRRQNGKELHQTPSASSRSSKNKQHPKRRPPTMLPPGASVDCLSSINQSSTTDAFLFNYRDTTIDQRLYAAGVSLLFHLWAASPVSTEAQPSYLRAWPGRAMPLIALLGWDKIWPILTISGSRCKAKALFARAQTGGRFSAVVP